MAVMTRLTTTVSALVAIALCQPVIAVEKAPAGKQFIYKRTNGEPQALEVYFPKDHDPSSSRLPCLLLFHGGCWGNGDLSTFRYDCSYFASRGIVAVTANYFMHSKESRLKLPGDVSRKQACVTDAKSAIRWIKQHADELGIDPDRIVVGGGSAGGRISLLSTLNPGECRVSCDQCPQLPDIRFPAGGGILRDGRQVETRLGHGP